MNLADFDRELAELFDRPRVYHGPLELHEVASDLCALYLATFPDCDVVDSCDVMAWIGHGEDDRESHWDSVERRLLRAVREHYSVDCHGCGGEGEDEHERRCEACHGTGLERGPWYPRVVVGNAVADVQRVVCGYCGVDANGSECGRCRAKLRAPLRLEVALRMSVAGAANDTRGGAA